MTKSQAESIAIGEPLSLRELQGVLSDAVRDLRAGDTTPASANAMSNAVGKILGTLRLKMDYDKAIGRVSSIPMLEETV